jgi:flagella basal body P-ring formation protein FlgA
MMELAALAISGCLALSPAADKILARDLAAALPQWAAVGGDSAIVPAPIPGVQRVLHVAELRRLAQRWNVAMDSGESAERDLCFAIPVAAVDPARMLAAMQQQYPAARIEILEASRQQAPEGEVVFPSTGLHATATSGYWAGFVRYGSDRRFAIWARVKITAPVARVVATRPVKAGQILDAADLRSETQETFPSTDHFVTSVEEAAGRVARRTIPSGAFLRPAWLDAPKDVRPGDTVQVEVFQGAARLRLEGVAQGAGVAGDTIPVENPVSKRRFPARVEGKGKVLVKGSL